MNLGPIKQCFVVMETNREGGVTLHEMFLDSTDAYEKVCEIIKDRDFREAQDENDHTVWETDDCLVEIRPCPCHLELP